MLSDKIVNQYRKLKEEASDCILLMQVGAFMKVIDDDARIISKATGIKLQITGDADAPYVFSGFPKTSLDTYAGKILRAGYSVAISFQDENKERKIIETVKLKGS